MNESGVKHYNVQFDDNRLLPLLYGEHDQHLMHLERQLGVTLATRGNVVAIDGPAAQTQLARQVLVELYKRLKNGETIAQVDIDAALRFAQHSDDGMEPPLFGPEFRDSLVIRTAKRQIAPRSAGQARYVRALLDKELTFGLGPAGTGKTYLAVAAAVAGLHKGQFERIVLSRPAVEAGERLGFLPGDLKDKVDPYLRPLYDALHDMMPGEQVAKRMASGEIEVAPLAFMRGRTLSRAFVILDEAQNTTAMQMKMFLTRLGEGSRMAITGDLTQIDLPHGMKSGLIDALDAIGALEEIGLVRFTDKDVVRHPLVARIVAAYGARDSRSG
ncbi:MAG TPA: PhoH family protein [Dongiaceae bacterium]|jgi:phosphate starvation-inducible PhoH-like protein|nr:PhoH family protein [Dongiaceae bacterium]